MKYINGTKVDERVVKTDFDRGFKSGRQFGRGKQGGQMRDELMQQTDTKSGWGARPETQNPSFNYPTVYDQRSHPVRGHKGRGRRGDDDEDDDGDDGHDGGGSRKRVRREDSDVVARMDDDDDDKERREKMRKAWDHSEDEDGGN